MNNKKSHLWTLIVCISVTKYAISQLWQSTPKHAYVRKLYKGMKSAMDKFMRQGISKASEKEKKLLDNLSGENAALIAETVAILSQIPANQVDWLCNEINKLSYVAVNRHISKTKSNENDKS